MKEIEYKELAIEIIDMLGVALYFAGAKKEFIEELIDIYIQEVEKYENDREYNQQEIIAIIKKIRKKYQSFFI